MTYKCEIKDQPAQPTLSIRVRTTLENLPQTIGHGFGTVAQYLGEIGQPPAGAPYVAYYNMDMSDLDIEIGFPVGKKLPGKGEIKASRDTWREDGHLPVHRPVPGNAGGL